MKLEGIVFEAAAAPYKPGARNATWQKVKCVLRQEFVIGGYERSVRDSLGALWLGTYDDAGRLLFAGKVGTGFQRQADAILWHPGPPPAPLVAVRGRRVAQGRQAAEGALGRPRPGLRGRLHGVDRA